MIYKADISMKPKSWGKLKYQIGQFAQADIYWLRAGWPKFYEKLFYLLGWPLSKIDLQYSYVLTKTKCLSILQ